MVQPSWRPWLVLASCNPHPLWRPPARGRVELRLPIPGLMQPGKTLNGRCKARLALRSYTLLLALGLTPVLEIAILRDGHQSSPFAALYRLAVIVVALGASAAGQDAAASIKSVASCPGLAGAHHRP